MLWLKLKFLFKLQFQPPKLLFSLQLAVPANVDNPQQNPTPLPLQVSISFLVICSLDYFSFLPTRLRLVIPCGRLLIPFFSLRKHRVSVVLLVFTCGPLPQFAHVLSLFVMFVCFASQTPGLCSALYFPSAPLPSLHTFYLSCLCASPHKHRVCCAFNFPSAPLPSLHTFNLPYFVCFASQTPVCVVLFISLRLPSILCTRFICDVLCPSPHKRRVCVVL